ncbi:MAG: tetratricopeptide repeat protein [Candidatus Omnitrophica bacterium]|nr:tetratricopeptide repeat protein [Candidatus Omnitrophota bacterium]
MARPFNRRRYGNIAALILICAVGIIVYSNTLQSGFHLDDNYSITNNISIIRLDRLKTIWNFWPTRFLTYLSVALNYHFGKLDVAGYHIFNIAIHLIASVLAWRLTLLTLSTPRMKDEAISRHADIIALFVGLIFVSHPVQTQAVTYIIQRATSMSSLFYLASLCLYARSRLSQSPAASVLCYAGSLTAAVLAMFTKEMALTLPFAILLYESFFIRNGKKTDWKRVVPLLATFFIIPLTMLATKTVDFVHLRRIPETFPNISPGHYLLTQFRVLVTYLRLIILPFNQNIDYDYPAGRSLLEPSTLASLVLLAAIIIAAVRMRKKYRLASFSVLWSFLALLPESSVIPIRDLIFEHRLYLPMFGFALFTVSAVYYLLGRKNIRLMVGVLIPITIFYGVLAYNRNFVWKDELSLWTDAVKKSPHKSRPYMQLATFYQDNGDLDKALAYCDQAIEYSPNDERGYNNRGNVFARKDGHEKAIADFNRVLELNPSYIFGYTNRGLSYQALGDIDRAIADFTISVKLYPPYAEGYFNRGTAYAFKGDVDSAIADFNKAIELNPNHAMAYHNRAVVHYMKEEYGKAWDDVYKGRALGLDINPPFLEDLKNASGRDR